MSGGGHANVVVQGGGREEEEGEKWDIGKFGGATSKELVH